MKTQKWKEFMKNTRKTKIHKLFHDTKLSLVACGVTFLFTHSIARIVLACGFHTLRGINFDVENTLDLVFQAHFLSSHLEISLPLLLRSKNPEICGVLFFWEIG